MKSSKRSWKFLVTAALCAAGFAASAADKPAAPPAPAAVSRWLATHTKAHMLAYEVATDAGAMVDDRRVPIAVALRL